MYSVLLVDPNLHSDVNTERMVDWHSLGFSIQAHCDRSSDAISVLDKHTFSLVLINMKGFHSDGIMLLCDRIRQKSRIPILLIGGDDDFQLARKALSYQVSDYIADPVLPSDLAASLLAVKKELEYRLPIQPQRLSLSTVQFIRKPQAPASIIDVVKHYIQEEMHQTITLKKISDMMHFNCAYLGQKFKHQMNMSFNEYLLQQRMEKAKRLLEATEMKIYEIANEVGYTEIDWFYKKFKAYTGTSANEYRKTLFTVKIN